MSLNYIKLLGVRVTTSSKQKILEEINKCLESVPRTPSPDIRKRNKPLIIVTPNPEQIVYAQAHRRFRDILNQADVALPDGIGLIWASHLIQPPAVKSQVQGVRERIPGVEFVEDLVWMSAHRGVSVGLIGGRSGVAVKALECLQQKYPGLTGWAVDGPEIAMTARGIIFTDGRDSDGFFRDLVQKIRETGTRIVFVGLGAPKQEFFIEQVSSQLVFRSSQSERQIVKGESRMTNSLILMSVGGSLDILSGTIQRAPVFMRSIGLEWLWRLVREPWRWKRQVALGKFMVLVLKEKIRTI